MDQPPHKQNDDAIRPDSARPPRGPDPDAYLLARHRAGDPDALGQLLQSHADRLYRLCLRMARNHATAEELAQDAMVRIIVALPQFDGRAWFKSWITRITINICLSHLRRVTGGQSLTKEAIQRRNSYFGRGGDDFVAQPEDSREPDPARRVQSSEEMADLMDALETLDPEHRALLILRDQQGHDYEQLAEIFAIPVGTIKSRLFRARTMLRSAIESVREQRRRPRHSPATEQPQRTGNTPDGKES